MTRNLGPAVGSMDFGRARLFAHDYYYHPGIIIPAMKSMPSTFQYAAGEHERFAWPIFLPDCNTLLLADQAVLEVR